MNIRTNRAANDLGIHPLNLLIHLFPLTQNLKASWPDVDDGFIKTLEQTGKVRRPNPAKAAPPTVAKPGDKIKESLVPRPKLLTDLSDDALRVIEKLWRKKRWGSAIVSLRTLGNNYCRDVADLEQVVDDLVIKGILLRESRHGAVSLNPSRHDEIDEIAAEVVK